MAVPLLLGISLMWIPVGLLLLGKGEGKSTGALTLMVGTLVCVGAIFQAAFLGEVIVAGLLFAYGLFYNITGYVLYTGQTDLRTAGNASIAVGLITIVYIILFLTGGPVMADGTQMWAKSNFLALACAGYLVLYIMCWLADYGKFSLKFLGWSLIIWTFVGLWVPAFWLAATGGLPMGP